MHKTRAFARSWLLGVLASHPQAQGALGEPTGFLVDVQAKITSALGSGTWDKCIGCARDGNGNTWVSVGNPSWTETNRVPGKLVKFDAQGAFVRAIDQPTLAASSFGLRDLAFDGATTIYGGLENGFSGRQVFAFDVVSESFVAAKNWAAPPVPGQGTDTVRGLAFDPQGRGGLGSLWACDYGPELVEFAPSGTVLRTLVIPGQNPLPYGLAVDPQRRALWIFALGGSTKTQCQVVGHEIALSSGQLTGTLFLGDRDLSPSGGFAGGCEFFVKSGVPTLLLLAQANSDTIYEVGGRFVHSQGCSGAMAMGGDAAYAGNAQWSLVLRQSGAGAAALLFSNTEAAVPMPVPLFAPGCTLAMALAPAPIVLPPVPVVAGVAVQALPIPNAVQQVALHFQWLEFSIPIAPPLLLSEKGKCLVGR